jgi:uncharacterized membrane protein
MPKNRLEAFSDGVLAIIITIMVLELKQPRSGEFPGLMPLLPVFSSYVLSFIYVGIYWTNHHHLLHTVRHVSAGILWSNLHLLFWPSLFPFATAWMGENHIAAAPTSLYGVVLLLAAIAYYVLQWAIIAHERQNSVLAAAIAGIGKESSLPYSTSGGPACICESLDIERALRLRRSPATCWMTRPPTTGRSEPRLYA